MFIAGDGEQAKVRVSAFIKNLGLRPMDTGPLLMARTLELDCLLSLGPMTHSVKSTHFAIGVSLPDLAHAHQRVSYHSAQKGQ
ncbi:hypothetical protein TMM008_26900 [Pseudomonas sp. 008]|nr:hypothetical protein TMM008_26900 [Pseudomonas sp. 008]